jgi:hypothetical protein
VSDRGEQLIGSSANRATLCELIAQREAKLAEYEYPFRTNTKVTVQEEVWDALQAKLAASKAEIAAYKSQLDIAASDTRNVEADRDNSKANHRLLIETTRGSCACRVDEDENVVGECGYHQHLRAERNKALDANAVLLSENCKLILERDKLNGYLQEIFDGVNIPILMGSTNGSDGR